MSHAELFLKPGKERSLLRRHPWIYATAVDRIVGRAGSGDTVTVRAASGAFLAKAAFSPASAIRARVWTFDEAQPVDHAFFKRRVADAVARRASLADRTDGVRLVFGEADGLPGLVVDRYGDQLVTQFMAAGPERWREAVLGALAAACGPLPVYDRSDASVREREGLELRTGPLVGEAPGAVPIVEDGVRYEVDVQHGHKTGFYLDQRENRRLVHDWTARLVAAGRAPRVLNCFSYTGGFSLAALAGGAAEAVSVDSSAEALAAAARQAAANGFAPERFRTEQADVFDFLKSELAAGRQYDLIVLDPPKFAPSAQHVERAARAYKEINLKGLKLLAPGGLLFTFSCSGAIDVELFQKIVAGAVADARLDMQLLHRLSAGIDHPVAMSHPEGEYLKGLCLRRG